MPAVSLSHCSVPINQRSGESTDGLQPVTVSGRPLAVDLFAGIGGLSLGFEQAGFDVVASVEYDPVHAAVHTFNFPRTRVLCRDISDLSAQELREAVGWGREAHGQDGEWDGTIDVIFGGPPCQGFSTMGKRLIDDKRNQLVFHFYRLIKELRPKYFVMENVPGMTAGGHSSILTRLIEEFEDVGYQVVRPPCVLNAADFGVPQDRRRLFLLGARSDQPVPNYPTPTVRPVPKRPGDKQPKQVALYAALDASVSTGPTVGDALNDLPNLDEFEELRTRD